MGWRQVSSETQGVRMSSTMTMETDQPAEKTKTDSSTVSHEHMLFTREVGSLSLCLLDCKNSCAFAQIS